MSEFFNSIFSVYLTIVHLGVRSVADRATQDELEKVLLLPSPEDCLDVESEKVEEGSIGFVRLVYENGRHDFRPPSPVPATSCELIGVDGSVIVRVFVDASRSCRTVG